MTEDLDVEVLFGGLRSGSKLTGGLVGSLVKGCHPQKEEIPKLLHECPKRAARASSPTWHSGKRASPRR